MLLGGLVGGQSVFTGQATLLVVLLDVAGIFLIALGIAQLIVIRRHGMDHDDRDSG